MTIGVVLMAYGTPRHRDEIEAYYTDIRRGRTPTPEQLADLVRRYDAIGGLSPLAEHTEAQQAALQAALGGEFRVVLGMRHARPSIEDAVAVLRAEGVARAVALVLAPHYSALSVELYLERAAAAAGADIEVRAIRHWHLEPAYVEFLGRGVRAGLAALPARSKVLFTAHSLPQRVVAMGDPYPEQLHETAAAVAGAAGLAPWGEWGVAYQSAGRTPEPWLGPDLLAVIDDLAAAEGASGLLVCSCGFAADHLEVLYDLDIEARGRADTKGLAFARTPVVNDDPTVMAALARRIETEAA